MQPDRKDPIYWVLSSKWLNEAQLITFVILLVEKEKGVLIVVDLCYRKQLLKLNQLCH